MSYVPSVSTNNGMGCISTNGDNKCVFGENGIELTGNLLSTPIVAIISQSGVSTTNANGFNILSTLNMNSNNISNVNTITATSFSGTATSSTNSAITDDNTNATFYPVFVSNNTGNLPLKVDKTTNPLSYNPSTGVLTSITFSGLLDTGGLVYLSTSQVVITGSASAQNIAFPSIFNSTYRNYRVVLSPTTQVSFTAYPSYALQSFSGTGVPTTASLYGNEVTSASSTSVVAVYTSNATISSAPLIFAVAGITNKQVVFEIENVGFANTQSQQVCIKCKSLFNNPGVTGYSDRHIASTSLNGATITGITIQQGSLSVGNNMTLQAVVYGYK